LSNARQVVLPLAGDSGRWDAKAAPRSLTAGKRPSLDAVAMVLVVGKVISIPDLQPLQAAL